MSSRKDGISCENCPFFDHERVRMPHPKRHGEAIVFGTCRFNAPVVNEVMGINSVGEFPWIAEDEWCARHPRIIAIQVRGRLATKIAFGKAVPEKVPSSP